MLNRSWVAISTTSASSAIGLLVRRAAQVVCPSTYQVHDFESWLATPVRDGRALRTVKLQIPVPEVIVLVAYDRLPRRHVPFNRRNLYRRDEWQCQYCGRRCGRENLSIDHITPRSRGGQTTWENCVLACVPCNVRKGDRSLKQVSMRLLRKPMRPEWTPCLEDASSHRHPVWQLFLGKERRKAAGEGPSSIRVSGRRPRLARD